MADIYGSHFEYAGTTSLRHGLIIANVETERFTQAYGEVESVSFFNKSNSRRHLIADNYANSPISIEVEILTDKQKPIDPSERRAIERWLFNRTKYEKFYLDMGDDSTGETFEYVDGVCKRLYLNCRFVNPKRLEYNGGIVGYSATLEADSGLWWQDSITKTYTLENESASDSSMITVNLDTDSRTFTYPKVTIQMGSAGGNITVANYTDDSTRTTRFIDLSASTRVILNGETNYISGQNYEKFYKQNFPRLLDGANSVYVTGAVNSITFEFNNRRFL